MSHSNQAAPRFDSRFRPREAPRSRRSAAVPVILDASAVTGVAPVNSVDFVKTAFRLQQAGRVLAVLRSPTHTLEIAHAITPEPGGGWLDVDYEMTRENRPAQIVFTSGTEGEPKAMLLSHRALADVVDRLNAMMKPDRGIREYVGVPVTYSFGFGRCRAVCAAGGRCFIPDGGFNPAELARMAMDGEINAVSAVPTLWRLLIAEPASVRAWGAHIKWIEIGSQYMSRQEKESMKTLFPNAVIVQHYGLTEASRTTLLNITETEGALLESVGQPAGGVEVKTSRDGRIMIRGPHLATGEIVQSRVQPLVDADGWYTTHDLGSVERGHLYYHGRADDVINCAGVKISPDLLQQHIHHSLGTSAVAVCRIDDAIRGDGIFVAVEETTGLSTTSVKAAAIEAMHGMGIRAPQSLTVQTVASIPRTDTGKVRRKELARLCLGDPPAGMGDEPPAAATSVASLFARVFRGAEITPEATFRSLGGDSLTYVQMLLLLERRLGTLPAHWDTTTVGQLEATTHTRPSALVRWIEPSVFLRVAAIAGVVATHSGAAALGGGTQLLFLLIGYNTARFKADELVNGTVWSWIRSYLTALLIPYYVVLLLYMGWNRFLEIDEVLLVANLVRARTSVVFPFWFVQVLVQCLALCGLLFSVRLIRRFASRAPVPFAFTVLSILLTARALYPLFWDTTQLNNLVPPRFLPMLWLGWCFYVAGTTAQRMLLAAIGVGLALADNGGSPASAWLAAGSIVLALASRIPVPAPTVRLFHAIGAATFHIFIINGVVIWLAMKTLHVEATTLLFVLGMSGSLALWWAMEQLRAVVARRRGKRVLGLASATY